MLGSSISPPDLKAHPEIHSAFTSLLKKIKIPVEEKQASLAIFEIGDRLSWEDFSLKSNRATFLIQFP